MIVRSAALSVLMFACSTPGEAPVDGAATDAPAPDAHGPDVPVQPVCPADGDGDGHISIACGGDDCNDGVGAVHPGAVEHGWSSDFLENLAGYEGEDLSAAIDSAGTVHVAFNWTSSDRTQQRLRYLRITPAGTVVNHEIAHAVTGGDIVGRGTSLALDSSGTPHVTFFDQTLTGNVTFFHAARGANGWSFDTPLGGERTAVALDGADHIHAATDGVRYVTNASGSWTSEVVAAGYSPAIVSLADGVHVVFAASGGLRHAIKTATGWNVEIIEDFATGGFDPRTQAVSDASGTLHVVYRAGNEIHHAQRGAAGWTHDFVGPSGDGPSSLLALPDGRLGIAYVEWLPAKGNTVELAFGGPGSWSHSEGEACGCYDVALVQRGDGVAAIYAAGGNLKMATFSPPDGVDNDCDGTTW